MALAAIALLGPLALYALLAALPPGRPARRGLAGAGIVLLVLWASAPLGAGPFAGGPRADALALALLGAWTVAALAALLAQALRPRLAATGVRLAYPLAATALPTLLLAAARPGLAL